MCAKSWSLRRISNAKKVTQGEPVELVNLNVRTVQKIEAGELDILLSTVLRLQQALDCPVQALFSFEADD